VVDQHIKMAGVIHLKALLYLLRHAGEAVSLPQLASSIGKSEADTEDAVQYWVEAGVLSANEGQLSPPPAADKPATSVQPVSAAPPAPVEKQEAPKSPKPEQEEREMRAHAIAIPPAKPTPSEVARRSAESGEIAFLLNETQLRLGRMISPGEASTLVYLHDWAGLSAGVILMVIEYAQSMGKTNMRYMEKVALSWADEEIDTLEKAERKLLEMHEAADAWRRISSLLGLPERSPSAYEKKCVTKWMQEWKMPEGLVRTAYDVCIDSTGKMSFAYMNKVLERWQRDGIRTPAQALEQKEKRRASSKKQDKPQAKTSYDLDAYERETVAVPGFDSQE
ncbi:MAG: DnaD domain protein, partial [Clostridiales bacterium]|nr:DnaD domain protein [Clostridiales bacterium]